MKCDRAVIDGERCNVRSYSSSFLRRTYLIIPQHIVVISILFITRQDLVGEDKLLQYDLAGNQQSLREGPAVGGEMAFAAALWLWFGFGGRKARSELTATEED